MHIQHVMSSATENRDRDIAILPHCRVPYHYFDLLGPILATRDRPGHVVNKPVVDRTVGQANHHRGLGMLRVQSNLLDKGAEKGTQSGIIQRLAAPSSWDVG